MIEGKRLISIEEIKEFCKRKNIEIKGELRFDPYCGFIDESDEYEFGYCVMCDINKFAMTCVCDEDCNHRLY